MRIFPFLILLALAACGDPLADVERLSDQDLAPQETTAAALPEDDTADAGGFLGRILNAGQKPAPSADAAPLADSDEGIAFGTQLAFGDVAKVCAAKGQRLGQKVETLSARGFKLFDSAPGTVAKRSFYLTGFSDGCPRQFTAANVIATPPSRYEAFRYGPAGQHMPIGATDKAYDKIKRSVCGAGKRKPCGGKISALDRRTTFLSAYEFFEGNAQWVKILIHDGAVVETSVKRP